MAELIKDAAKRIAGETLKAHWDGRLPVDPASMALRMGVGVFRADLEQDVSGLVSQQHGDDPHIFLQRSDSNLRQNFTCAHELGHVMERQNHPGGPDAEYSFTDYRRQDVSNPHEFFANEFAGNLLMPEAEVKRHHRRTKNAIELAREFGVSVPAMRVRLKRLGLDD